MAYIGEFTARGGVQWKVEIVGAGDGTLVLPADRPLTIEWPEKNVEDVICGSMATLKIESQTDREFINLYTEKVGEVHLNVYRNNSLFWRGCLDPEFYEEPYSRNSFYDVSLTFSDFGLLNRLSYNMIGRQLMSTILSDSLERLGLETIPLNTTYISSHIGTTKTIPSTLMVDSANFYDEENEASPLSDVIDSIFQPLAIKMIQKNGSIYLFDMNGIATDLTDEEVYWDGVDSMLKCDKVYNKAKVTFSPYVLSQLLDSALELDVDTSNLGGYDPENGVCTVFKGVGGDYAQKLEGDKDFTIFYNATAKNLTVGGDAKAAAIRKIYAGNDEEVVIAVQGIRNKGNTSIIADQSWTSMYIDSLNNANASIITSKKALLNKIDSGCILRLNMPMLWDTRYNPYREATDENNKTSFDMYSPHLQMVEIQAQIRLYDADGNVLYSYKNANRNRTDAVPSLSDCGEWVAGTIADGYCYISYYNRSNLKSTLMTGSFVDLGQFCENDQFASEDIDPLVVSAPAGQYIPCPPVEGYIEIQIRNKVRTYTRDENDNVTPNIDSSSVVPLPQNLWFKPPYFEICENRSPYNTVSCDDIEYKGVLDENAANDISIETTSGTNSSVIPCARGCIMNTSGEQIHTITRNGVTDSPEQLLIGTLLSAYGKRHTKLSGTIRSVPDFTLFTDENTTGYFHVRSEEMDCYQSESKISMVEISQDNYKGK